MSSSYEDTEAQRNELDALKSIFEDLFSCYGLENNYTQSDTHTVGGELKINVDIPDSFYISLGFSNGMNGDVERHSIRHLPPIFLRFTFPPDYPSCNPPKFILTCKWLNRIQLSILCRKLDEIWNENESEIIYDWMSCLQSALNILGLNDHIIIGGSRRKRTSLSLAAVDENYHRRNIVRSTSLVDKDHSTEDTEDCSGSLPNFDCDQGSYSSVKRKSTDQRAIQDVGSASNLICFLLQHNEEKIQKEFESLLFHCKVCFNEKCGLESLKFWPCSHVYCKLCMKGYFETQIKEGNITFLRCPEEKCNSEANPKQVEDLISSDLFKRWDEQLLNSTLSSLGDIQPCPRAHCQYPVTIEGNQGQCPSCAFVFCGLCRFGAHGIQKCRLKGGEVKKVIDQYMNGCEMTRKQLEMKYTKKYLTGLTDEFLSMAYLDENAKECPRCRANIEKETGCNKMTCNRCGIHFCWLCLRVLNLPNPYTHFHNPSDGCFNRLFEGIDEIPQFDAEFDSDEDFF